MSVGGGEGLQWSRLGVRRAPSARQLLPGLRIKLLTHHLLKEFSCDLGPLPPLSYLFLQMKGDPGVPFLSSGWALLTPSPGLPDAAEPSGVQRWR